MSFIYCNWLESPSDPYKRWVHDPIILSNEPFFKLPSRLQVVGELLGRKIQEAPPGKEHNPL